MSILTLLLTVLYSSFFTASRSWSLGQQHVDKIDADGLVHSFLRRTIEQAQPLLHRNARTRGLVFSASADRMAFTATLPSHRGGGGLYYIKLFNNEQDFTLSYRPIYSEDVATKQMVLLADHRARFAYFGVRDDEPAVWHDQWVNKEALPALIRIRFSAPELDNVLPDMLFALRVNFISGQSSFLLFTDKDDISDG